MEKSISPLADDDDDDFDLENVLRGAQRADEEAGIRPKHMGVVWDGLTVRAGGGVANLVKTFPDAVLGFFNIVAPFWARRNHTQVNLLDHFRGVAKPGEMVLVLGRPGSGCSTFLKVISNERSGYTSVTGNVKYGSFDAHHFGAHYRGEAVYSSEDDIHHPTLTVGQTLNFALDTKTPGTRALGVSKADFKRKVIATLLRMFNIEHTHETVVGNAFIRGVSGGERKRVSIAEMMVTNATVCAWDNSTRGLDASTALDYIKSLRIMTNIYKTTTFVSLYQASENIYRLFDKVLVIDSGRQVYMGPTTSARAYFENLGFREKPRQTTPDFLTGCTDDFEREYADGRSADDTPHTPAALAQAFIDSEASRALEEDMATYRAELDTKQRVHRDFETAVSQSKHKATSRSVYSIPMYLQIWVLIKRQFLVKRNDTFSLYVSWITSLTIALVFGSVWLSLPQTSSGAFTRGGVLFFTLLFNTLHAFSEIASTMLGRPILNKHRAYTFHRPSALWIAQIIVDMLFAAVEIFFFCLIVYFMCNLVRDAGAFFTFYLVVILAYLGMTLALRTVACISPDFDIAIRGATIVFTACVIPCGYLIQYQSQKDWYRWIYWINPIGLGFGAIMANEFTRIDLTCVGSSLVPSGDGYGDVNHQVCTLPGSQAGSLVVSGTDYVRQGFSYVSSDIWRNIGIMIAVVVGLLLMNILMGEYLTFGGGSNSATVYQKPNEERRELNNALARNRQSRLGSKGEDDSADIEIASKAVLTWEGLNYDVPVPHGGNLRLLNDIYGYVRPGELTALMGASGAGKTTLLDVLALRKNIGVITGDILVDGIAPGTSFQRQTSYAEQLDTHEPQATVREALRFSAELRQPYHVPREEKYAYVEEIISLLEMEDMADAIIGDPEAGLAVEQRKRVTIGVELAAKPELLLFLDEPTSGLDSQAAFNICRFLKKLAAAGQAILCTIHQPNASLFENFDRLLLLQRGGRCVYFGDIGKDAVVLRDYFHRHGAHCPSDANPAEWMLDAIGAGQAPRLGQRDWADVFAESPELASIKARIGEIKTQRKSEGGSVVRVDEREYATPILHQLKIVQKRTNLSFWRTPNYGLTRLFIHVVIALFTGLMFIQLDDSRSSLQYRVFVIFQVTVLPAIVIAQVQPKYAMARMIFFRESSSKMYGQFAFASSLVVAEMPYSILSAVAFFLLIYYLPGFQSASSRAGYQFLLVLIAEIFSVTLGQTIAAMTPTPCRFPKFQAHTLH